jgi:hypothetical protein
MIVMKPTVGRVVWYYTGLAEKQRLVQPRAATVAYVQSDKLVNLTISNPNGGTYGMIDVYFYHEGETEPVGAFAEWMPYQLQQAKKDEAVS